MIHPGVTILIAAYQEEAAIAETLQTVAEESYPGPVEVLVLNDGSSDRTAEVAADAIDPARLPAQHQVRLVDFPVNRRQGRGAQRRRSAQARHELIVTVDGDTRLNRDALTAIVERLMARPRPDAVAVAGAVLRAQLAQEPADPRAGVGLFPRHRRGEADAEPVPGHAGRAGRLLDLPKTRAGQEAGGWPDTVGEDIVLSWALLRKGYRIGYAEDAIVWTNAPTELKQFARQRQRWARGLIEALNAHQELIFKPRLTQCSSGGTCSSCRSTLFTR